MLACQAGVMGLVARTWYSVRAAVHAALGVPRLFRSARRAGAGYRDATDVLICSAWVLFVVAPRAAGAHGRQNAVRHFVWQAVLTARHGEGVARSVADAQEQGSVQPLDSAADRRNNSVGQAYGAAHSRELHDLPLRTTMAELLEVGLTKWRAGELAATRGEHATASAAPRRRRGSRGRATPRTPT
jgi:hypothetical protein